MTRLRLLPEAKEELRAAAEFYESEQRGLGRALLQEVRRTLRFIAERPEASRAVRGEVRVRTVARFPSHLLSSSRQRNRCCCHWSSATKTRVLACPRIVT